MAGRCLRRERRRLLLGSATREQQGQQRSWLTDCAWPVWAQIANKLGTGIPEWYEAGKVYAAKPDAIPESAWQRRRAGWRQWWIQQHAAAAGREGMKRQ